LAVGGEEIVLTEFARQDPGDLFEGDGFDDVVGDCGSEEADFEGLAAVWIFVLNSPEFDRFDERGAKLFAKFASKSRFGGFSFFHFSTGKLPFEGRGVVLAALADE